MVGWIGELKFINITHPNTINVLECHP